MKILLVTSRAASSIVREIVKEIRKQYNELDISVYVVDYPTVASSFTVNVLRKKVPMELLRRYDIIIVPGLTRGDLSDWSREVGVPIYKGTIHAVDIPLVIEVLLKGSRLSEKLPADYILYEEIRNSLRDMILKERAKNTVVIDYNGIKITDKSPPMIIVAEIPPQVNTNDAIELAKRYEEEGADIIVIGSDGRNSNKVIEILSKLSKSVNKPLGIDTNNPAEIVKALDKGASIVFSLNRELLLKLKDYSKQAIYTIIPDKGYENPYDINIRIESILNNVELAIRNGFDKIIVDPILGPLPLGFTQSLMVAYEFKKRRPLIPVVFSASNITESLEADTHGVLAVLAGMAFEVGASVFHIVEDSPYEYMSVAEARIAIAMAEIAYARRTQERNIGINLLVLKDNKIIRNPPIKAKKTISINKIIEPKMDKTGYFKIIVNRKNNTIETGFFKYHDDKEAILKISGSHALSIGRKILEEVIISNQHALYLGYELARAEIALKLGKNYIQDEELFETIPEKLRMVDEIVSKVENSSSTNSKGGKNK